MPGEGFPHVERRHRPDISSPANRAEGAVPTPSIPLRDERGARPPRPRIYPPVAVPDDRHAEPRGQGGCEPARRPAGLREGDRRPELAIPDRPGNNRLDTLSNILANPNVGLLFLVPGFDDTLRINGTAQISTDRELLRGMSVNDRVPTVAIVVSVAEVFLHCAKAFRRSRLRTLRPGRTGRKCPPSSR